MTISKDYLSSWFLIDAAATFPAIFTLQHNKVALSFKMLRICHLFDIFQPLYLLLEHVLMRHKI